VSVLALLVTVAIGGRFNAAKPLVISWLRIINEKLKLK